LKKEPRVTILTTKTDTLIQIKFQDSKIILEDLKLFNLCNEEVDKKNEVIALKSEAIQFHIAKFDTMKTKYDNGVIMVVNLEKVVENKNTELALLNDIIKKQKREITKQKIFKFAGFSLAIALPITYLLLKK
tara:strand:- start:28402 stop:28797 length:396 start_codon:yes stop_codon:yes gene_type:complete